MGNLLRNYCCCLYGNPKTTCCCHTSRDRHNQLQAQPQRSRQRKHFCFWNLLSCCCFCCCCGCSCCCPLCRHIYPCNVIHNNSVGIIIPEKKLRVLLLGLKGSGKTEIAHQLARIERRDYDTTNGVRHYNVQRGGLLCSLTEVGGNEDMQKIWHHYYVSTMGLIYCFDMSGTYNELKSSVDVLNRVLRDICMKGKPVLMVATKSDLADECIQLYDIENAFQLERITAMTGSIIKLCHSYHNNHNYHDDPAPNGQFWLGIDWLLKYLWENFDIIQMRLKCDRNTQKWEKQRNQLIAEGKINLKKYQRFRKAKTRTHIMLTHHAGHPNHGQVFVMKRPYTAPPTTIFTLALSEGGGDTS